MKTQLRRFELIKRIINMDSFYAISIYEYSITLQAHFNPTLVLKCKQLKFKESITVNGFLELSRNGIIITLTN